jgi:2,3-bisphosphoglycerate-independent phosphoglycerate mutase
MHILLFFIDGLGLGKNDSTVNPLITARMQTMRRLLNGNPLTKELGRMETGAATLIPTDATLGVAGLPQSATGQTALFTGINAAKVLGTHLHAFPTQRLRDIIADQSILKQIKQLGGKVTSANAYTPNYFDLVAQKKRRNSASTLSILAADIPLNLDLACLEQGDCVYQDLSNAYLQELGYDVSRITPEQAGKNLARIVNNHHFTLFEYFQTDMVGHKQNWQRAEEILEDVDRCLGSLLTHSHLADTLIIITSDHGNIEDLAVKSHTYNQVPTLLIGAGRERVASEIHSIPDIAPAVIDVFKQDMIFSTMEG